MSDEMAFELKTKGLDKLTKALRDDLSKVRVGILGEKAARSNLPGREGLTNATVGAFHEFGTTTLPKRSFLREPITEHLQKNLEASGAFTPDVLKRVVSEGNVGPWLEKAAVVAEGVVLGAFDSGGYGKWVPSNMDRKKVHQTLVETQQLRNSITSEVKKK